MTILNFSGRGRGRGGRGHGFRGRGFRGRGRHSFARSAGSSKWVRPRTEEDGADPVTSNQDRSQDQANDEEQASETKQQPMTKRGNNQLILTEKAKAEMPPSATEKQLSQPTTMKRQGKHKLVNTSLEKVASFDNSSANEHKNHRQSMKKLGRNKLVVNKIGKAPGGSADLKLEEQGESSGAEKKEASSTIHSIGTNKDANADLGPLRKVAPNKLIVPHAASRNSNGRPKRQTREFDSVRSNHKRSRWSSHTKRIALTVKTTGTEDHAEQGEEESATVHAPNDTTTSEKLTDFAYRQTSRVVQRGQKNPREGSTRAAKSGPRNMGLVRVQPNEKKTPVCPVFLRGVECTDKYCRKRHDVPKEFAMPVCSFFQRQGQCLKGDECMFRHVKVNPRATVCPSFALLGFCEDEDCVMKHVRENNSHHSTSVPAKTNKSRNMKYVQPS